MALGFDPDVGGALNTSLKYYWNFNDNSNDTADAANGTDDSMSYASSTIDGKKAVFAAGGHIDLPTDSQSMNPGSWNFWTKSTTNTAPVELYWYFSNTADNEAISLRKEIGTRNFAELVTFNGSTDTLATGTTDIVDGTWHMVTVTYTGTSANIYIDAASAEGTNNSMHNLDAGLGERRAIGIHQPSGTLPYFGDMDEFGFWTKVLSSQERTDLYNSGSGNAYRELGGMIRPPGLTATGAFMIV